ncbi:MAG: DUF3179 domain-containing protein [Alphaproteobacteria bacterium]
MVENRIIARESAKASPLVALLISALLGITFLVAGLVSASANPDVWKNFRWPNTDFSKTSVDFSEILSGGPPKDGIPSIDNPIFKTVTEITDLADTEPVVGLEINGDARAYPLQVLMWHEIVNDTVGGLPLSVTFCPLCNTALVFEREIGGVVRDFGTTGKLRISNLIMYDRQSQSWWQQYDGKAIVGEMLGATLKGVPARLEAFGKFKARFPNGKVLVPNNPGKRKYGSNPYTGYDSASRPFLFSGDLPEDIDPMARVIVVEVEGKPKAVSMQHLRDVGKVTLGDVELAWEKGQNSALDTRRISDGRDVGNVVARRTGAGGAKADIVHHLTFAFVFRAFVPGGVIVQS